MLTHSRRISNQLGDVRNGWRLRDSRTGFQGIVEYLTLDLAKSGRVERRKCARLAVSSLIFVKLEDVNGGIAFNISEDGLALSAANGLPHGQIPELSIQLPDSGDWIRASGQIQWRSNSNKECGVRLVGMDEAARHRIREWIDAEISSADPIPGTESSGVFPDVKLNGSAPTPDSAVVSAAENEDDGEKEDKEANDALEATPGAPVVPPAAEQHADQSMLPQAQPESESRVVIGASIAPKDVVMDRRIPPAVVSAVDPYYVEAVVDRRIYPRKRIIPLGYVQLGEMNGGVALNVSEGGLSVTAAHVLLADHLPSIQLQFPDNTQWLEVRGEIVWRNESKREAGVRFVDLPEEARLRLRKWLSSPVPPARTGEETELSLQALTSDSSPSDKTPDRAPESSPPPVAETSPAHWSPPGAPSMSESQSVKLYFGKKAGMICLACTITAALLGSVGLAPLIRDRLSSRPQGTKRTVGVVITKPLRTETADDAPQARPLDIASASRPQRPDGLQELNRKPELPESRATGKPIISLKESPRRVQGAQRSSAAEAASDPVRSLPETPGLNHATAESLTASVPLTNPTLPREEPRAGSAPAAPFVQKEVGLAPPIPVVSSPANAEVTRSRNNSTHHGGEAASLPAGTEPVVRINGTVAIATDPYPSLRFAGGPKGKKSRHAASLRLGQLVSPVEPPYPAEALQKGVQGTVRIHVIVSPEGSIGRVVSVDGPPLLVPATIRAVQQWRYSQTLLAGRPVETEDNIAVTFEVSTGINR